MSSGNEDTSCRRAPAKRWVNGELSRSVAGTFMEPWYTGQRTGVCLRLCCSFSKSVKKSCTAEVTLRVIWLSDAQTPLHRLQTHCNPISLLHVSVCLHGVVWKVCVEVISKHISVYANFTLAPVKYMYCTVRQIQLLVLHSLARRRYSWFKQRMFSCVKLMI